MTRKPTLAIIGTGISGLACAHFLQKDFDLSIFEKDNRIGGHSNTVEVEESGKQLPLDTGFMVYNEVTYPLLTRLFQQLGVETKPTCMSFSVRHEPGNVEFNGGSLNLLFAQRKNLLNPRFWRMLARINRFNKETVAELADPRFPNLSLAEYVTARNYGADFLSWYLSPMAAAVWSSPPQRIKSFPAHTLMRFWQNHGFLGLNTQHPWRTVIDGSRQYVKKISAPFAEKIQRDNAVLTVHDNNTLTLADGSATPAYDRIILASHGDQSLKLLAAPTSLETELLADFPYQPNQAIVHTDPGVMPRTRLAWASWNYQVSPAPDGTERYSTHYWMNSLQGISQDRNYFVSINPAAEIPEEKVIHRLTYEHPLFDLKATAAQARIPELHLAGHQTNRFYCGAWQRYGFHEDGIWSAYRLCHEILNRDPWS
ncbi:MAG: FAD-dependent oxidoreductase [Armatimonadetes bacterium]|nr:FAD-dependent oxidoreductase [Akkermansiaceae bacterium]